jgi:AraC family transcriptional regulator, positive regulator of tynA and feaB
VGEFLDAPSMNYESFIGSFHSHCGRFHPQRVERETFIGRINARDIASVKVIDIQCNAERVERTQRDIALDGVDHYYALVQIAGGTVFNQQDRIMKLQIGDVALLDAAKPVAAFGEGEPGQWVAFHFPRRALTSHFGFEPSASSARGDTLPSRLLFQIGCDAIGGAETDAGELNPYFRSTIYDLIGAMFADSDSHIVSRYSEKLYGRLCRIIEGRYAELDLKPSDVAAEAGISIRYLQKLFTLRGSSFTRLVQSLRLNQASRLLHRRKELASEQPISEIAYACGFCDYTHFARQFRRRFGHAPSAHAEKKHST